jgi:hypothetical protein
MNTNGLFITEALINLDKMRVALIEAMAAGRMIQGNAIVAEITQIEEFLSHYGIN